MRIWFLVMLASRSMTGSVYGSDDDAWYERHTTANADTELPEMEYQNILFEVTEMLMSSKFQLQLIVDVYHKTNWSMIPEMKVLPGIFDKATEIMDNVNITLQRKMDLGYHFVEKDFSDPISKVTGDKLTDCFREIKVYVEKLQTEKMLHNKNLRKSIVEMRLQVNTAIQELENKMPYLLEQMRLFRNRVTKGPY